MYTRIKEAYNAMVDLLSAEECMQLMGGDACYKAKAERAKRISTSKFVHLLADAIITECRAIETSKEKPKPVTLTGKVSSLELNGLLSNGHTVIIK